MDESLDAFGEHGDVEVHQETDGLAGELEVADDLCAMYWCDELDGLEFDDQCVGDQQVEAVMPDVLTAINDRAIYLATKGNRRMLEFDAKS